MTIEHVPDRLIAAFAITFGIALGLTISGGVAWLIARWYAALGVRPDADA